MKHVRTHAALRTILSSWRYTLLFLFLIVLLTGVALSVRGRTLTNQLYDTIRTTVPREDVVIVGIDDKSLELLGAWPWERTVFADVTNALASYGARIAAFDVLFFEPRAGDAAFKQALLEADITSVLASKTEKGVYLSSYLASGTKITLSGVANVVPDADGKVRRYPLPYKDSKACVPSFAEVVANEYLPGTADTCGRVGFFRYPEQVASYSLVDVLKGNIDKQALRGKVVFIGSTSLGLEDHFVGRTGSKVPGVYIHASILSSILNGVNDKEISPLLSFVALFIVSVLAIVFLFTWRSVFAQVLSIGGLVLLLPVLAVILFEYGYSIPLPWMVLAVVISSGCAALIRFVTERKQNEEIRTMFSKYVHKDVLEELMRQGSVKLGGEKKELTVLFSDIRGFTTLSETLSPEELTQVLNDYLSAMTPHILEERGTIDKFIGDAIMAFWNAPLSVRNHEHHAVMAALRMQDALTLFNKEHGTALAAGIGIHAGFAIVGNVGGQDRVNYTILGDTVNLASRLEGITKKYGVGLLVTESVRSKIHDESIVFRQLDTITVVGKSIPTRIYEARRKENFPPHLVEAYEKAHSLYAKGKWDEAEPLLEKLAGEGDHPSEKMLARIPELRSKQEWDGVWRFDEK